jgi:hypothetical protein
MEKNVSKADAGGHRGRYQQKNCLNRNIIKSPEIVQGKIVIFAPQKYNLAVVFQYSF